MRLFFFKTVALITGTLIGVNLTIGNAIGSMVAWLCNGLSWVFKIVGERLMLWIDADRYRHASMAMRQAPELMELGLLMAANKVKDDAVAGKVWTAGHTGALNSIANDLHVYCGWEPARIHGYLRPLVESIEGMGYSGGDESEGVAS